MAAPRTMLRPLGRWKSLIHTTRAIKQQQQQQRFLSADAAPRRTGTAVSTIAARATAGLGTRAVPRKTHPPLPVFPPPPSALDKCKDPIATITAAQLQSLDPTGARARLFAKTNPEAARVGDVLLVRQRTGEPFAGVCLNIRRRGVDTAVLLRGQLTRVGVELWVKVFSPNVEGVEVVQRAAKRARRARLYYLRQPRHDRGSVENIVRQYMKNRAMLGSAAQGGRKGKGMKGGKH